MKYALKKIKETKIWNKMVNDFINLLVIYFGFSVYDKQKF